MTAHAITLQATSQPARVDDDAGREALLVREARDGDRDAFAEIVKQHERRVFRLAGRFYRRREDVEDAAQETFLKVWEKLHTFRGEAPLESWITRVCLNVCYARLRRDKPTEELADDFAIEDRGSSSEAASHARLEAESILRKLPAPDRFLLLMLHGEGWSVAEIAERTGWSLANVKVRAFRARRKLQRELSEESS